MLVKSSTAVRIALSVAGFVAATSVMRVRAQEPSAAALEFFESKVRPVLVEHCYRCHSTQAKKPKGGLLLDSRAALLKGGDNGPALVPGEPAKSRLLEAIAYTNVDLQMPPKGKLPAQVIADLTAWVKMGTPWPKDSATKKTGDGYAFDLDKRKKEHWSWQSLRSVKPPAVRAAAWPASPIDQFLLARLEAKGIAPAPPADRSVLLRRLYFDLIGLPPGPDVVDAFVKDASPLALEKAVDALLASPHFGERWGRHWLDLVRYGESRGHEFDYTNPNAFHYRDYVIRALNADLPYHQFVVEHLAGDLLPEPRRHPTEKFNESILGTGFWFLGEQVHSPVDTCQDKADRFDNMLDVMSKTFLGLTVACARCHDHKFDAISTKDYYSLFGFLESSSYRLAPFDALDHNKQVAADIWKLRDQARPEVQRAFAVAFKPGVGRLTNFLLGAQEIASGTALDAVAAKRQLDATRLQLWVKHLAAAGKQETEPFHAWVKASAGEAARLQLLKESQERSQRADMALAKARILVDYRGGSTNGWQPDGVLFGPGPAAAGDLDASSPKTIRFHEFGAATADLSLDVLKPAAGAERDPGALGNVQRSGRTLRTPTFEIEHGRVYCLVRGAGTIYASVDAHVMIAGPLHGQMIGQAKATGLQWHAIDLTRYKGRRGHLEFTPAPGASLAIAVVVESETPPGSLDRAHGMLPTVLAGKSPEERAAAYQGVFLGALDDLAGDKLVGSKRASAQAHLLNWLVRNADLFSDAKDSTAAHETWQAFQEKQAMLIKTMKTESRLALAMLDGSGVNESVFIRGNYKTPGEPAPRRFLEALAGQQQIKVAAGSGRLELAQRMIDPALNPYVPRVMVNRIWHHLFGRGIVASVDNFGVLGEAPTHPELLDFLALQFVADGWSVKKTIRRLVLTKAYQMSSRPDSPPPPPLVKGGKGEVSDPENLLLHRARIRRLEGEAIRDAMLHVSGRLDAKLFGPPVPVYLTDFQQGRGRPASGPLDGNGRRSIYLSVRRNFLPSFLLAFDTPIPFSTVGKRTVSNVPAQALILLNDPFVHQQAELWAKRALAQPGAAKDRIQNMYLTAFARHPSDGELAACLEFVGAANDVAAWKNLAHVLFNAKEFIFLQ